ncbi:MAG: thioredoxin-dependent thiol peroxidase [Ornithinimicrobium sp.]|uniref:thioredoxin-dependent thiol peroxidase n=1 Tax=Ornithinimicrobium sp. TaxID=1977084 RepID=UPI0026E06A79|nr:thioredoxin-dependent thiol peroxidase [Ornithinimicrobium sp.]MDO5738906.1 thioredoxin-dependent thiol peroxidase [Ornithinimicrobium sp.]
MSRLETGQTAPAWTLHDAEGTEVSLSSFAGRKLIIYVYPAAMTPGCTTEACDFRDNEAIFAKHGYAVVGVSPDAPAKLATFAEQEALSFPLLSDESKSMLEDYGAYGEKKLYGKTVVGVIRSTFVVDEGGKIELARYNVKATGHVASLAKALGIDL